jgi:signal transduction histidine kinase
MKIRLRLLLLLGCLLAVFAAALLVLQGSHRREGAEIWASVEKQRSGLLDRVLALTGQSLHSFVSDYAPWDEMLRFVETGDRAWAKINIDASLPNFGVQGAWVLRPDGTEVYQTGSLDAATLAAMPLEQPAFRDALRREKTMHFYLESPAGLLEVRTAPIQPSDDLARSSPARGWLVVARLWSDAHVRTLAEAIQSEVDFSPRLEKKDDPATVHLLRPLPGWTGAPVRTLHVAYHSLALERLLEGNVDEAAVLFFFGLVMLTVTGFGLSRWVLGPLHHLGQSLETGRPEPLQPLQRKPNEFGHLARLVEQSFTQRAALEHEVRERSRMAAALQEAGTRLRESIELRSRLARDLHDGVIQSIYAAGLGLEGVRSVLATDPAAADRRLAASQAALNDTIRDVRTFINGLESETAPTRPFRHTLDTLIATMQAIQPGNITLAVDENLARRISPAQEMQVLQILRESISNALRHAAPSSIHLSLQADAAGQAVLSVADDGTGFDPAGQTGRGHGLINLGIRAREMGGALQIDSKPGKGTRITLTFHPTYPP